MSKSMVPESIMKIFLMIAVIIVGMSFLLKAFGIDIFGWLEEKFKVGIPDKGKILHVKIDPEEGQNEIFEFHITDADFATQFGCFDSNAKAHLSGDKLYYYFYQKDLDNQYCIILATDENAREFVIPGTNYDSSTIYKVSPGSVIQEKGSIKEEIVVIERKCSLVVPTFSGTPPKINKCSGNRCELLAECDGSTCDYTKKSNNPCTGESNIIFADSPDDISRFKDTSKDRKDACNNLEKVIGYKFKPDVTWRCEGNKCNLLNQKEKSYQIKYGLLCGSDGLWHTCSDKTDPKQYTSTMVDAVCDYNGYVGTWNVTKKPLAPPVLVSPADGIMVSYLTPILDWGDVTAAKAYKFYLRTASQNKENPTYSFCSLSSIGTGIGLSGDTYFWSAKACSDNSCTSCGVYAAERSLYVEKATESTTGWSSFTYTSITLDSTSYMRGSYSIKFSGGSATGRDVAYRFDHTISLSQSISFFMKSDASGNNVIDVVLRDTNQNVAIKSSADTITNNWKSIQINSRDFKVETSDGFDWSRIREISFSIPTLQTALWIDGIRFE